MGGRKQYSPALLVVALLLSSAATPLVHAQMPAPLSELIIGGQLCCTSTGNCPGRFPPGIPGVQVRLECNIPGLGSGYITTGLAGTNLRGGFLINVSNLTEIDDMIVSYLNLPCLVDGGALCPLLNTTNLVGYLTLLGTLLSPMGLLAGNYWTMWR